jgi:DNA-binding GntR family transcriptional regulator
MKMRRNGDVNLHSAYEDLKNALSRFDFRPGQKLVISDLADHYSVSNTPIREILNRLYAEGFVDFQPGTGFSCKIPDIAEMRELYSLIFCLAANAVETGKTESVLISIEGEIQFLHYFETSLSSQPKYQDAAALLNDLDREIIVPFLAGGKSLFASIAENALIRTRLIRWVSLEHHHGRHDLMSDLQSWAKALRQADVDRARRLIRLREEKQIQQLPGLLREAIARIYIP